MPLFKELRREKDKMHSSFAAKSKTGYYAERDSDFVASIRVIHNFISYSARTV